MPDIDESAVHRGASGSVHDSKVHEEFYSPVKVAMRTEREYARKNGYCWVSLTS